MSNNMNKNKPKIFEWAYFLNKEQRQKEYRNLCKTYKIKEKDWTINISFDLLENYIFKQYELCSSASLIFYFRKVGNKLLSAFEKNEVGLLAPASNAEFAVFNLNIETPHNGVLFCIFEKNTNKKNPWIFKQFISSNDSCEWMGTLIALKSKRPTLSTIGYDEGFDFLKIDFTKPEILMEHIKKRDERFLTSGIREVFNFARVTAREEYVDIEDSINEITEEIVRYNIKQINKDECLFSWAITDFDNLTDEDDYKYFPVNILYPFRLLGEVCAAMVFRITHKNEESCLVTIFDLEQAYMGAKLYNPTFKSTWLTIENVRARS